MKKFKAIAIALVLVLALVMVFSLAACGNSSAPADTPAPAVTAPADTAPADAAPANDNANASSEPQKIVVGASSTPHAEILEFVKPALAEQGYELDIVVYDDYVLPNKALDDGELDANYFQHSPYLFSFNDSNGTDLVPAVLVHYEPFGVYGNGVSDLGELADGATIIIPADDSNETRALLLLQQEGLITLPDDASAAAGVTTLDIVDDGGYKVVPVQADSVPAQLDNSDAGTVAVINGNYALQAGLKVADALAIEDASGDAAQTYANVLAVRNGDENSEKIQALVKALTTDSVKEFIASEYNGAVVAIF
ncbi:MAG: MetQ/NlpA family ABC transporter substrate-binding protein [Butyricicoccus sp.]|nr:MetQ/NlpA family ABC transporter substrate-binding protein [Butyricicoccus sp.]